MCARQALSAVIAPTSLTHEAAARPHDEPCSAELGDVLAADPPRSDVVDVVVERPAVVRHLQPTILASDRPDQRLLDALACLGRSGRVIDGPGTGAVPVAAAGAATVVAGERVERTPVAAEEDLAVA